MTPVHFLREAEIELLEAVVHYEECATGLGLDFEQEVKAAVTHIGACPEAWSPRADGTRRYLLNRFPYIVIYCVHEGDAFVLGVAACREEPRDWEPSIRKSRPTPCEEPSAYTVDPPAEDAPGDAESIHPPW